jgi:alpha-beta hydrolase superfamily lysophospholipase
LIVTAPAFWRADIDPAHEPRRIAMTRGVWVDARRHNRDVPFKIYAPADDAGPFPVVLWSHGLGGSRDGAGFISRFLCAHGYIVVHIQHRGTDSGLWEGKPGHPWDVIRNTRIPRHAVLQRYGDVPFALNCLESGIGLEPDLKAQMDLTEIGMSGHSFGAHTTAIMAGQKVAHGPRSYRLFEPRFRAGILYSPVPAKQTMPPAERYGTLALPLFHMTGTDDTSPVEGFGYERRLEVFEHSGAPDQHLLVLKDGDHMVYNGSRGKLGDNPNRARHEDLIKIAALAFWDRTLKMDPAADLWLTGGGFAGWLGGDGTYTFRP